jgi:putative proteasome-type protease
MTYCVAMNLNSGLVFASDSRTNAGSDYVTSYSKMHLFTPGNDRLFVLLSAGNLATTQEVINRIKRDLDFSESSESLMSATYMFEAADYIGRVTQEVQQVHASTLQAAGVSGEVSWILGGQISGQPHSLMMIYPQGNYIEASESTPYLQIGENKYGKPVLDRVLDYNTSLEDAGRLALVSLTSTANSNKTVGPPFEVAAYESGTFSLRGRCSFDSSGEYLTQLEQAWKDGLNQVFQNLPHFQWDDPQQQMGLDEVDQVPSDEQVITPINFNK